MKKLIILTICVCATVFLSSYHGSGSAPQTFTDTVPKKQYQYFYKVGVNQLNNMLYVADSLVNDYGVEMGGTKIKTSQTFYITIKNELLKSLAVDSILIKTPKK